jgi:hypothetical protein
MDCLFPFINLTKISVYQYHDDDDDDDDDDNNNNNNASNDINV